MAEKDGKAADIYRLQNELEVLKEQVAILQRQILKNQKVTEAMDNMARVFGEYRGTDNRKVPAIITAVFPRAGTVDIFVFDNSYSGGRYELTGIELGTERGQVMPYLSDVEEGAPEDADLMASGSR